MSSSIVKYLTRLSIYIPDVLNTLSLHQSFHNVAKCSIFVTPLAFYYKHTPTFSLETFPFLHRMVFNIYRHGLNQSELFSKCYFTNYSDKKYKRRWTKWYVLRCEQVFYSTISNTFLTYLRKIKCFSLFYVTLKFSRVS